jgi:hypothetical protein
MVAVSELECTNSATGPVIENQIVLMTCTVTYHGFRAPAFTWDGMTGELEELDPDNPNRLKFTANVTADPSHDGRQFRCNLFFEGEDAPTYTDSCTTEFEIQYAPTNIRSYPSKDDFDNEIIRLSVGDAINCSADGNPIVDYDWYGVTDPGHIVMGNVLTMEDRMITGNTIAYRCRAYNRINGVDREANLNVTLYVTEGDTEPSTGGVESWQIAVGICVPLVLIGIGAGVAFFMYRRSKKDTSGSAPPPQKSPPVDTVREPGPQPGGPKGPPNMAPQPRPKPVAYGNVPPAMSMLPVHQQGSLHSLSGRDSPGYGDLGIRHFGASNPGLDTSVDMDPHPTYAKPQKHGSIEQLPTNGTSGQSNQNYQRTPPEDRSPYIGSGSIV